jgi:hypothetical protein
MEGSAMKFMERRATRFLSLSILLLVVAALLVPATAGAQSEQRDARGAIIRIDGDAVVASGESRGLVVVIDGDARIAGYAASVFVIDGRVIIEGGTVGELGVLNGTVEARDGSVVTGNVTLIDAEIERAPGAVIRGTIQRDTSYRLGEGLRIFGLIFGLGYAIAVIIGGIVVAAVAPRQARYIGSVIADEPGRSMLAALVAWIALPILAVVAMVTIIGIPLGIAILVFLMPALAFVGYLLFGIRLGDFMIEKIRGQRESDRPYLAVLLGIGALVVVGWVPVLGSLVSFLAACIGSGAIALAAWRTMRRKGDGEKDDQLSEPHHLEEEVV